MHTTKKLNATPRERMLELESRFPSPGRLSPHTLFAALAGAVLVAAIAFLGWTAGRSMHGLYGGYTDLIVETSAPQRDF